jgi:hypothetical protein
MDQSPPSLAVKRGRIMTPDLFDEGSERLQAHQFRRVATVFIG